MNPGAIRMLLVSKTYASSASRLEWPVGKRPQTSLPNTFHPFQSQTSMAQYKRESHARSLIKGISWRIVATCDTIAVVALVTWFNGEISLDHAVKIGLYEFVIKYVVYYLHERIWENIRSGDGLEKSRTLKKAISWRIVATTMTFVIASMVLGGGDGAKDGETSVASIALWIAMVEFVSKFILYYFHERIWAKIPLGRIRNWLIGKKKA